MRFVQLRAFHNVAIHGGFSRAGDALGLTQPAISDQVRKLEAEYDVRLFNRHKKQVCLTAAGRQLLDITYRMFEVEQQARDFLSDTRSVKSGALKIVASSAHHVLPALARFGAKFPAVKVSVSVGNTTSILARLNAYDADIGETGGVEDDRSFDTVALGSSPIVAFAARGNELARRPSVTLTELARQPLVMREAGSRTRAKFEAAARAAGVRLATQIEAEGREAVREIVASGGGVGVVSEAEFGQDHRLVKIPIAGPQIVMDETLIALRERRNNKLIAAFMDVAQNPERSSPYPASGVIASLSQLKNPPA